MRLRCCGVVAGMNCLPSGQVTAVGFEPTPLRTGALSQRLRPLRQTVMFAGYDMHHISWHDDGAAEAMTHAEHMG